MSPDTRPDPLATLLATVDDVRRVHAPNEWDICITCRTSFPCDAEMLAELVVTAGVTITQPQPDGMWSTAERARAYLTQPRPDAGLREADVLRANLASTADWLDAIIEESDPKPSELMAMVAGIRAALRSAPAAPKEDDRD